MMRRLLRLLMVGLATLGMSVGLLAAPASAAEQRPVKIIGEDFPDPDVIEVGGTWYAYSTNNGRGHVPVASAPSPEGPWQVRGDAMPGGPSGEWAQAGRTWAPDVHRNPDGSYTLTYTAWHRSSGRQCVGVATASSPLGPFTPRSGAPLICPLAQGGAIDANTWVAGDGTRYLLWKNDGNAIGQASTLWLVATADNGTRLVGGSRALISSQGVIEAPDLVQRGSQYVLFFSGGDYGGCGYVTSYATAGSLDGPWQVAYRPLVTTASVDNVVCGPGGADITGGPGGDRIFFHGWVDGARHLYVAALGWSNDYPVVRGSRVRYEAERGRLTNCVVRTGAAGASQGAVAAYIDFPDSAVEVDVYAPRTGGYRLYVTYANGMGATSTHTVAVNGAARGEISYPAHGWDQWREVSTTVDLNEGLNTIRLGKGQLYAELDFIEIL